jgi:hypothetical protein
MDLGKTIWVFKIFKYTFGNYNDAILKPHNTMYNNVVSTFTLPTTNKHILQLSCLIPQINVIANIPKFKTHT